MKNRHWITCFVMVHAAACKEEPEPAEQNASAAASVAAVTEAAENGTEAAQRAAMEAERAVRENLPEGTDPKLAARQVEIVKKLATLQTMQESGGGAPVNWRQLTPFLNDTILGYSSTGKLNGTSNSIGSALKVTTVDRRYKQGDRTLRVSISDAIGAPLLKAPFVMAAAIEADAMGKNKKAKQIDDYPAIVEFNSESKRSKVMALVGDRFVVDVSVTGTDEPSEAEAVLKALELKDLAEVKANQ